MGKKVGYYIRRSHISQNTSIQEQFVEENYVVYSDTISGRVQFSDRVGGGRLLRDIRLGKISMVVTNSCDRLGRSTSNILETISTVHSFGVPIRFIREGITTLDEDGNQTPMGVLMVNLLSTLSEFFYLQTREKTLMGIERGKLEGKYRGRKQGSVETLEKFKSKPKVKKIVELLDDGIGIRKISRVVGCSPNYIYKVKEKFGLS